MNLRAKEHSVVWISAPVHLGINCQVQRSVLSEMTFLEECKVRRCRVFILCLIHVTGIYASAGSKHPRCGPANHATDVWAQSSTGDGVVIGILLIVPSWRVFGLTFPVDVGPYRAVGAAVGWSEGVLRAEGACCGRNATTVAACVIPPLLRC